MNTQSVLLALYAVRAQVDALIAQIDASAVVQSEIGECPHPEDQQVDASTAGGGPRRIFCLACNTERDA